LRNAALEREKDGNGREMLTTATGTRRVPITEGQEDNTKGTLALHYNGASRAMFHAKVGGVEYAMDSADWGFKKEIETHSHSVLQQLGNKKYSAACMATKMEVRGDTMVVVLDTMLAYHCGGVVNNGNVALAIAGYPSNNRKKVPAAVYADMRPCSIDNAPVNPETLFARAIVAVDSSYKRKGDLKESMTIGPSKIQFDDANAWRQDSHLGQYNVSRLFE
jgi:hypothetical protein